MGGREDVSVDPGLKKTNIKADTTESKKKKLQIKSCDYRNTRNNQITQIEGQETTEDILRVIVCKDKRDNAKLPTILLS